MIAVLGLDVSAMMLAPRCGASRRGQFGGFSIPPRPPGSVAGPLRNPAAPPAADTAVCCRPDRRQAAVSKARSLPPPRRSRALARASRRRRRRGPARRTSASSAPAAPPAPDAPAPAPRAPRARRRTWSRSRRRRRSSTRPRCSPASTRSPGASRAFDAAIGETVQFGALQVTARACYSRPPTETPLTDGFVEVDEVTLQGEVRRIFTGWMFAASPGLHAVEHPIYDVWLTDCKGGAPPAPPPLPMLSHRRQPSKGPVSGCPARRSAGKLRLSARFPATRCCNRGGLRHACGTARVLSVPREALAVRAMCTHRAPR